MRLFLRCSRNTGIFSKLYDRALPEPVMATYIQKAPLD
ncbi:hypothetical protein DHBDCA_p2161 [Dehalobacter sp. DCA]|nr:hypothetical protein DHBDCA_p2161 [Dehalobacter sp. DCA]